jgi:hypothetical protein
MIFLACAVYGRGCPARTLSSWRTRNYVGTIFGGSMYSAVDPIYMVMLTRRLGKDYFARRSKRNVPSTALT